jgi:hypothetical protein
MTDIEQTVLRTLRAAWPGHRHSLRLSKLAKALDQPTDAVRAALDGLKAAGHVRFYSGKRGPDIELIDPPTERAVLFYGSFRQIPEAGR